MNYNAFKDIKISGLGLGCMRFPQLNSADPHSPIDYEAAKDIIIGAYNAGVNYFDTAYVYGAGDSEKTLGKAVKELDRASFYIATKFNVNANPDYRAVFEEELERLQTDYIDFYLIHCVTDGNVEKYLTNGCIDYFLQKQAEGKIKYLGFSSHASTKTLERFASHHQWDFAQIQLNAYDWCFGSTKEEYEILTARNIPIAVMEPVRGGRLAALTPDAEALLKASHPEWSVASWVLRFVKSLPGVYVTLSGMSSIPQLTDNIATFADDAALNDADMATLMQAIQMFKNQLQVPCTECRYCKDCPVEINIPEWLKLYNSYKVDGRGALHGAKNIESVGKPADCVGCGACTGHCPQNIDTPAIMEDLAKLLADFN